MRSLVSLAHVMMFVTRYMTYWHLYSRNAGLLLYPYPLCCDWSMASVPPVETVSPSRREKVRR